uniref:Histidine decarboxylase n=1 Tax=Callistoctopus minor TaxID=515824 RepID=A0AAU7P2T3_CALMC
MTTRQIGNDRLCKRSLQSWGFYVAVKSIPGTASEATFVALLAARTEAIRRYKLLHGSMDDSDINGRLVAYCSDQVCGTLGTTGACAFDNLTELGAYRKFMVGIEHAHSMAFNPSKWMMVNFECTAMIKDSTSLHRTFNVDPLYLKHENSGAAIDYMHWQIPLSKRFRALKLWFVIRSFGVEGLQKHIRHGKYVIRFTVTSQYCTEEDIRGDLKTIQDTASVVLRDLSLLMNKTKEDEVIREIPEIPEEKAIITSSEETKLERSLSMKRRDFGMSLILSHVPCSPKFINGSFAAIFDNNETILEFARHLTSSDINGRPIRLSPRRGVKLREQAKQHSLDFSTMIPGRRMSTGTARFKQGSLDTKVDDILDSTPDNYYTNGFDEIHGKKNDKEEGKENDKDEVQKQQELDAQNQQNQQLQVVQLQQNQLHSVLAASQEKASSFLDKIKKLTPKRLTGDTAANNNVKISNGLHVCPHCGKSIV